MRSEIIPHRGSRSALRRLPFRPLVEMLESRLVPSTIDHSMGFAVHGDLTNNGPALFTDTVARLTDGHRNEAGSIFSNSKFDITQFTMTFTFVPSLGLTSSMGDGLTFTIQNDASGPAALGSNGSGLGY